MSAVGRFEALDCRVILQSINRGGLMRHLFLLLAIVLFPTFAAAEIGTIPFPRNTPDPAFVSVSGAVSPRADEYGIGVVPETSFGVRGLADTGFMYLLSSGGIMENSARIVRDNGARAEQFSAAFGEIMRTDLNVMLGEMLQAHALPVATDATTPRFELTPLISAHFRDETHFTLECIIFAQVSANGRRHWQGMLPRGRFRYAATDVYDVYASQDVVPMSAVRSCLDNAYRVFAVFVEHRGAFDRGRAVVPEYGTNSITTRYFRTEDGTLFITNIGNEVTGHPAESVTFEGVR